MERYQVTYTQIITRLKSLKNQRNIDGMARFGISGKNVLGISIPFLRQLAKKIGKDHALALLLWDSGIHEARLLACFIDEPSQVTSAQMEKWVKTFDSWDICDQCCGNLFDRTDRAYSKALVWSRRKREFEKRAGFVLMAALSVHDKKAGNKVFLSFLPILRREAWDERNFVKKAVNWALRQIGKRNRFLNRAAIQEAKRIQKQGTPSARWIATDALRELTNPQIQRKWQ
jgi:3-methyladenine DNA glycosylase AlkD